MSHYRRHAVTPGAERAGAVPRDEAHSGGEGAGRHGACADPGDSIRRHNWRRRLPLQTHPARQMPAFREWDVTRHGRHCCTRHVANGLEDEAEHCQARGLRCVLTHSVRVDTTTRREAGTMPPWWARLRRNVEMRA